MSMILCKCTDSDGAYYNAKAGNKRQKATSSIKNEPYLNLWQEEERKIFLMTCVAIVVKMSLF